MSQISCKGAIMEIVYVEQRNLNNSEDFLFDEKINSTLGENFYTETDLVMSRIIGVTAAAFSPTESTSGKINLVQPSSVLQEHEVPNIILYSLVLFLAVLGNFLVILTLLANRQMRTVTSCFLLSLSVSDLLLAIICMPISLTGRILKRFVFGTVMCKIMPLFMGISVSVSTFTMLAISVERYYAICRPLKSRVWQTVSHAWKIIIGIWIVSFLINIPYLFLSDLHYIPLIDFQKCSLACRLLFPSAVARQAWYVFLLVSLFCIPGAIMTVAYVLVSCKIWSKFKVKQRSSNRVDDAIGEEEEDASDGLYIPSNRPTLSRKIRKSMRRFIKQDLQSNKHNSLGPTSLLHDHNELKSTKLSPSHSVQYRSKVLRNEHQMTNTAERLVAKKRVVRMLIVIVVLFFVCWTPLSIVNVWKAFDPYTAMEKLDGIIEIIQLMSYVSTCVNPVVYCFMNQRFRTGFINVFLYCFPAKCKKAFSKADLTT